MTQLSSLKTVIVSTYSIYLFLYLSLLVLNINVSAALFTVAEGSSVSFTITKDKRTAVDVGIKVTPLTYQQYSKKAATDTTLPSLTAPPDPAEGNY